MSRGPKLFANLGAEEGETWPRAASHPRVRSAARLWAASFAATADAVGPLAPLEAELCGELARDAGRAALEPCDSLDGLVPWLSSEEAAALARREGLALSAAAPAVVARVHDKGFALEVARAHGLLDGDLAEAVLALSPGELESIDTARCRIEAAVARWPAGLAARFVLKPRWGTSGRGRLTGRDGRVDPEALAGNLARLRARGGCLVEPWLERVADLSAQLWVGASGDVHLLGTLEQLVTPHGVPLGHRGRLARDGAVESGSAWDGALRAAALVLGRAAAEAGYTGPCGLDAFSFRAADGSERFRPVVELNARFTAGTSALALLARAHRVGLADGARAFTVGTPPAAAAGRRVAVFADDSELGLWLA